MSGNINIQVEQKHVVLICKKENLIYVTSIKSQLIILNGSNCIAIN